MTFYTLSRPGGPWEYNGLGFTALTDGAVLDGSLFTPPLASPPDAFWTVGGSAEANIKRHGQAPPYTAPQAEPADGAGLVYNNATNQWEPTTVSLRGKLASWPIYVYGNSYSILSAGWFSSGNHYAQRAATAAGGGTVTSYGVSGRRIIDVISTLLNGAAFPGCNGVIAAGKWPGVSSRSGLVVLESFINDMGHYPNMTAGVATPAAVTTAYRNAMKVAYRAALALISSESRVEASAATVTGTWTRASSQGYPSGGLVDFTTANAATATFSVTPPQTGPLAGKVYLLGFTVDPALGTMAAQEIRVDTVLQTSRTPAPWEQYVGHTGVQVSVGPDIIEVTLPIDGAAHSIELKHVGSAGHLLYNDCVLIPSTDPNPIAVMGAEHTIPGTPTWTAAQTGVYTANNRTMAPDLKSVVAEFTHAFYVPSTMTTGGVYSADGLHPNDRGMAQRANDLTNALDSMIRARLLNRVEANRANSEYAII